MYKNRYEKEGRKVVSKKKSPLVQDIIVDPGPCVFFQSQPHPVFQAPFLSQVTLRREHHSHTSYYYAASTEGNERHHEFKWLLIHLSSLAGDDSQWSSSGAAVPLTLIPAQPEGGQVKTWTSNFQPPGRTLLAAQAWKRRREIEYRQC